ncbi:MAG TPA: MFS transporter, partial [Mycobacterium sp.]|nr:MFS transporter [Mycobacterium sp.]
AFGQVLQISFLANLSHGAKVTPAMTADAALHAAQIAFIGPLLGSIARPLGGSLSDRIGGSRVTLYVFAAMIAVAGWLVALGRMADASHGAVPGGGMAAYVAGFVLLFVLSGIGNGSVYKMIPSIFDAKAQSIDDLGQAEKADWSRRMSGALIGIAGAIGALGGVGINVVLRASYLSPAKSATTAFGVFLAFYVVCAVITWFAYVRTPGRAPARKTVAVAEAAAPA